MVIQLLVVTNAPSLRKTLRKPRKKTLVDRMAFAKDTFVQQAQNRYITTELGRRKIKVEEGFGRRKTELA